MHTDIRPLTDKEIDDLERALGKPVDRNYLVHWISQSIADAVTLAGRPTPRQMRDMLLQVERDGRELLSDIEESNVASFLAAHTDLPKFRAAAAEFCDHVGRLAGDLDTFVRGRPRTPAALEAFVDRMIGIAKRAAVLPSTPSRSEKRQRLKSPPFFEFVTTALRLARKVIRTSPLPADQQAAALAKLQIQSTDALNKLVVELRGRIGNYRETPHGLVEWWID